MFIVTKHPRRNNDEHYVMTLYIYIYVFIYVSSCCSNDGEKMMAQTAELLRFDCTLEQKLDLGAVN